MLLGDAEFVWSVCCYCLGLSMHVEQPVADCTVISSTKRPRSVTTTIQVPGSQKYYLVYAKTNDQTAKKWSAFLRKHTVVILRVSNQNSSALARAGAWLVTRYRPSN